MNISTSTTPTLASLERKESSTIEIGESFSDFQKKQKPKGKEKEKIKVSIDTKEKEFTVSYQDHPIFLQFLFDRTVIPLIKDFQKVSDTKEEKKKEEHLLSPRGMAKLESEEISMQETRKKKNKKEASLSHTESLLKGEIEESSTQENKRKKTKNVLKQAKDIKALKEIAAQSQCFELLKGIAQQSILLKMEVFQLTTLRVNAMNVSLDGIPRLTQGADSLAPSLAILAVRLCVGQLIARKKATNVWTWQNGKQFLNELTALAQQHFNFRCTIPSDILLYAIDTETYQDPNLEQFIRSTTDKGHKSIKKIVYKHKDNIDDEVLDKIIKAADPYFYDELPTAASVFYKETDRKLKFIAPLGQSFLFRQNTVASVRFMKQAERNKHLRLTNTKELPEGHKIEKKDLIIDGVKHKLTLVKLTETNLVKVITLAKEGTEEVDVYLFVQFVNNPDESPLREKETQLLKFDITPGTNQIWIKEAEPGAEKAILNEFKSKKYVPSIYTAIQFKSEIILTEIFKQAGFSMNTRLRAGAAENYLQSLKPKYDDEFKKLLGSIFESAFGAAISKYLSDSYHNSDLDIVSKKSRPNHKDEVEKEKDIPSKRETLLARKSIAHHKEEAVRRKKDYLESVRDSMLGAMHDDPLNPMDLEAAKLPQISEKINIEFWMSILKDAIKDAALKDEVLLALTETIHNSISHAFNQHKKTENALKMLDIIFEKNVHKALLELESKEVVFAIFENLLNQWEIELTKEQQELCSKFFKNLTAKIMA